MRGQHVLCIDHEVGDDGLLDGILCRGRNPQKIVGRGCQGADDRRPGICLTHFRVEAQTQQSDLAARFRIDLGSETLIPHIAADRTHDGRVRRVAQSHQSRRVCLPVQADPDVVDLQDVLFHADVAGGQIRRDALPVKLQQVAGQNGIAALNGKTLGEHPVAEQGAVPSELHIIG